MGLLTDPTAGQGKLTKALLKFYTKLCILLYLGGLAWFCSLAYPPFNGETYFSENALLPGLVQSEFLDEQSANTYYIELMDEMLKYEDSIPYSWLLAKFRQIGLDTYTHNFTLNYPLGQPKKYSGKNVYAILRAARSSSTEALILSVPYRPPLSVHPTTAPSIAIMLAFAKFANKEKYWAKDIIFLITEHEQLGIQAWLEAYHSVSCGKRGILNSGDINGRAGAIQAAINLELHDINIGQIDMKVEGLNGQLPNLDLFNLVNRMCIKERVDHTFKNKPPKYIKDPYESWLHAFKTMMAMVSTQATSVPNGNHGLFHRFGIEALTMEGFSDPIRNHGSGRAGFFKLGRILEGVFRSLNNLLERFHQSYFFYLLPAPNRFISIGLYMPSVSLMIGALFIKACARWYQLQENPLSMEFEESDGEKTDENKKSSTKQQKSKKSSDLDSEGFRTLFEKEISSDAAKDFKGLNYLKIVLFFIVSHILGVVIMNAPHIMSNVGLEYEIESEASIFMGFTFVSLIILVIPYFLDIRNCYKTMTILNIMCLLELGTALICISMNNFSLGLYATIIYTPLALFIGQTSSETRLWMQKILWLLVHPFVLLNITVFIYTQVMFPGESLQENMHRAIAATKQAMIFGIVDNMIYGNWLYSVVTCVFLPNWLCFWCAAFYEPKMDTVDDSEKKTN